MGKNITPQAAKQATQDSFQEVRRHKRRSSNGAVRTSKMPVVAARPAAVNPTPKAVLTRNFFAPVRAASMDTEASDTEENPQEEETLGKTCRPPPIVIAATTKVLQLQKFKSVVKENFEFRNTRNGTRVITKTLAYFVAVKSHNPPYFPFYPKSLKPNKVVISHLPLNTPAQDIPDGLTDLHFEIFFPCSPFLVPLVMGICKVVTRSAPYGWKACIQRGAAWCPEGIVLDTGYLPRWLTPWLRWLHILTLAVSHKCQPPIGHRLREPQPQTSACSSLPCPERQSQEIFRLRSLCHTAIRAQNGLTQCPNCQQFGNLWAN
jgi:hypothetical protein